MPPNLFREKLLIHESGFACGVQILDAGIVHRTPMSAHEASAPKMLGMDPDGRTFSSCSSKNRWKRRGLAAGFDAPAGHGNRRRAGRIGHQGQGRPRSIGVELGHPCAYAVGVKHLVTCRIQRVRDNTLWPGRVRALTRAPSGAGRRDRRAGSASVRTCSRSSSGVRTCVRGDPRD